MMVCRFEWSLKALYKDFITWSSPGSYPVASQMMSPIAALHPLIVLGFTFQSTNRKIRNFASCAGVANVGSNFCVLAKATKNFHLESYVRFVVLAHAFFRLTLQGGILVLRA